MFLVDVIVNKFPLNSGYASNWISICVHHSLTLIWLAYAPKIFITNCEHLFILLPVDIYCAFNFGHSIFVLHTGDCVFYTFSSAMCILLKKKTFTRHTEIQFKTTAFVAFTELASFHLCQHNNQYVMHIYQQVKYIRTNGMQIFAEWNELNEHLVWHWTNRIPMEICHHHTKIRLSNICARW